MKILVLMPLDEKYSFLTTALFGALSKDAKEKTFAMNMFSEWQIHTKKMILGSDLPIHWNVATFGSIIKAKEMYKLAESSNQDFLLIGNISPDYKFDIIFNFQDAEKSLPYSDLYIQKLREVFANDKVLMNQLDLYDNKDSSMSLTNISAAGEFLSAYLKTDPNINDIKEKYSKTLNFKVNDNE